MNNSIAKRLAAEKKINIICPESVYIADDVDLNRISRNNVTIYPGCKIMGTQSLIMENSTIGKEAPVCLEDTMVGPNCKLHGGYFSGAVFTGGNTFGSCAHVRKGTILEEQANAAHSVGLKQTLLFPFVTLGSLINFCDCFMAGGTSRKNHSEVGSSFVHFNFTPNQDKATPSMMGDVSRGVMLDSKPIFLGGQGGLVGPVKIEYGCTSAAGSIIRKSEERPDRLILGGKFKDMSIPRQYDVYTNVTHIFNQNIEYIANLLALYFWYIYIRPLFNRNDILYTELNRGLQDNLLYCINDRLKRLEVFCEKLKKSKKILENESQTDQTKKIQSHIDAMNRFQTAANKVNETLSNLNLSGSGESFIKLMESKSKDNGYISCIQNLNDSEKQLGIKWLSETQQAISHDLTI